MYKVLLFLIFLSLGIYSFNIQLNFAYAQDNSSPRSIAEVKNIANFRDRLVERITLFFKFSPVDKIDYQQQLAEKRLAELKYLIDNNEGDLVEDSSLRYSAYIGRLTEEILKNKQSFSTKETNKKVEILTMFETHSMILNELIQKMEANSGFWLLLKHNINYVQIYSDQIKNL